MGTSVHTQPGSPSAESEPSRLNERIRFITDLTLRTDGGVTIIGYTKDVSLSGAFLYTEASLEGITQGESGVAAVTVQEGEHQYNMVFPCIVARVTPQGLGLHFDEPDAEEETKPPIVIEESASELHDEGQDEFLLPPTS
ncbi:MAG: PilZ domain-containing protein [Magnetococcales bacterium]|nr:PilZ domain-containing protein [Magnetococcales bacterium]